MNLYDTKYRPSFSGHETFPLRHGWLKKAYDFIEENSTSGIKNPFGEDHAIAFFGVGKNMVISIRHWAQLSGIISDNQHNEISNTTLANALLSPSGVDPFFENPNTVWLIHFNIASNSGCTTWHWFFNHFNEIEFNRNSIQETLSKFIDDREWKTPSEATLKRDIDCFLRLYTTSKNKDGSVLEDSMDSLFSELMLIQKSDTKNYFRINRGDKSSLSSELFFYCLARFWANHTKADSLSLEAICFEPGSPGRIFLLDEEAVISRLANATVITDGALNWSETAGLKQVLKNVEINDDFLQVALNRIYENS